MCAARVCEGVDGFKPNGEQYGEEFNREGKASQ